MRLLLLPGTSGAKICNIYVPWYFPFRGIFGSRRGVRRRPHRPPLLPASTWSIRPPCAPSWSTRSLASPWFLRALPCIPCSSLASPGHSGHALPFSCFPGFPGPFGLHGSFLAPRAFRVPGMATGGTRHGPEGHTTRRGLELLGSALACPVGFGDARDCRGGCRGDPVEGQGGPVNAPGQGEARECLGVAPGETRDAPGIAHGGRGAGCSRVPRGYL